MPLDEKRINMLSAEVKKATSGYSAPKERYKVPIPGIDYRVPEGETPESIAAKLNSRKGVIDASVIKGMPLATDIVGDVIAELKTGKKRLEAKDILNLPATQPFQVKDPKKLDMNDLRWHGGGGLSEVTHDSTLVGDGTANYPLSVASTILSPGFQAAVGAVNGVNQVFDFATAPNIVSVDGVCRQKVQSNGAVNWTGTTTITLSIAPNDDIFGVN